MGLEQKRIEAAAREERQHKELMDKLEARRLEDMGKEKKAVPEKKKKEKAKVVKLDNKDLFQDVQNYASSSEEEENWKHEAASWEEPTTTSSAAISATAVSSAPATIAKKPTAKAKTKPAKVAKPVLENKWGSDEATPSPAPDETA